MSGPLRLIPAASLGLIDDPDPVRDELPGTPGYTVTAECADCAANAATIECLRAEVARLREMRRLDYELLRDFDVYGTGGDVSSCIREIKMQLGEARTATDNALRENESLRIERRALLPNAAESSDLGLRAAIMERDE